MTRLSLKKTVAGVLQSLLRKAYERAGHVARVARAAMTSLREPGASLASADAPAGEQSPLDRVQKALVEVDREGLGLEIGPSFRPIASKAAGFHVEVIDHATAAELREKYKNEGGVDVSQIEEVDHIWRGEALDQLVGTDRKYDWIIASHVVEHLPDLLSFLQQCERVLSPKGVVSLVIPDKRYCFDHYRWPSSTGDVLQAWAEKRRRHPPGIVFDCVAHLVKLDDLICWGPESKGEFHLMRDFSEAMPLFEHARKAPEYIDVHAWRFTPASFNLILSELRLAGLLKLGPIRTFPTAGCEFFVTLGFTASPPSVDTRLQLLKEALCESSAP